MGSAHARAPGILTPLSLFFCRTRHAQATTPPQSVVLTGAVQAVRAPDSPRIGMTRLAHKWRPAVIMFTNGPHAPICRILFANKAHDDDDVWGRSRRDLFSPRDAKRAPLFTVQRCSKWGQPGITPPQVRVMVQSAKPSASPGSLHAPGDVIFSALCGIDQHAIGRNVCTGHQHDHRAARYN